jgi:hypothetical protein
VTNGKPNPRRWVMPNEITFQAIPYKEKQEDTADQTNLNVQLVGDKMDHEHE